jgi:hypothetical protein
MYMSYRTLFVWAWQGRVPHVTLTWVIKPYCMSDGHKCYGRRLVWILTCICLTAHFFVWPWQGRVPHVTLTLHRGHWPLHALCKHMSGSVLWMGRGTCTAHHRTFHDVTQWTKKNLQFLPYGRSTGSWICLTHKTYTCHTVQITIRYGIRFTGIKVRYTIFERVTMYNNAKRTLRKLQRFISTVILL